MANPSTGVIDKRANRWEPFIWTVDFEGFDYSAATFIMQVRSVKDSGGTALVDLATVGSVATQGITITGVTTTGGIPTTSISIRINEATMEGLPLPPTVRSGEDVTLYYDLQITPSGGVKYRALEGAFTVHAGVTH